MAAASRARTATARASAGEGAVDVEGVARRQRRIQRQQDTRDAARQGARKAKEQGGPAARQGKESKGGKEESKKESREEGKGAVQAGPRRQPEPPLPAQHLSKPGRQADMAEQPRSDAPHYRGSGKLEGMSALITGGDSGIGRAVAVLFAREGADVTIVYLSEHEDAQETARLVQAEGRRCVTIAGDVKNPGFCTRAVNKAVKTFGKLDVLVNNAAFQEHADDITDITEERLDETLRTNVYGYFHMARAAVPHLREGASIINTGSVTGLQGSARLIDYSTTKGAIHAFTKALAANLLPRGIRVNAVAPGPVWTPLNPADKPPEEAAKFGARTDMKRPAQPEELSPAYVFLAAPACASYITGIVLPITGSVGE